MKDVDTLADVAFGVVVQIAGEEANMGIVWKYKIDLVDENVFSEIEKSREIKIPDEMKKLIIEGNAATPEKYNFMVGDTERVLGAILSFNKNENDTDTVYTALEIISDKNLLPFAIDPFGNYICLAMDSDEIVFWNHETGNTTSTGKKLNAFLESLY